MKREWWVYLIAFIFGCICVNITESGTWDNYDLLNRYHLSMLSVEALSYDSFFIQIFILRFKTAAALWIASKLLPKKIVVLVFFGVLSAMSGAMISMSILANGLWGFFFIVCAVLPQCLFYLPALLLWSKRSAIYTSGVERREKWIGTIIILCMVLIGCVIEAYVSPVLIEKLIKY